jgi:uncharacterized protein (TIGR02217 family)
MGTFHDTLFIDCADLEPRIQHVRRRVTKEADSGHAKVSFVSKYTFRNYDLSFSIKDAAVHRNLISFFECRMGRLYSFRFHDWSDYSSTGKGIGTDITPLDQTIGIGNGVSNMFQVTKTYGTGPQHYKRPIQALVPDTFTVAVDGTPLNSGYKITDSGVLLFDSPPANNAVITCGFLFHTVTRFGSDNLSLVLQNGMYMVAGSVELKEVLRPMVHAESTIYRSFMEQYGPTPTVSQWLTFLQEWHMYEWVEP